ncbi:MAG TPA: hypothetical protein VGM87_02300 [Roseomonas sp.]|jgi:hypothetical protein
MRVMALVVATLSASMLAACASDPAPVVAPAPVVQAPPPPAPAYTAGRYTGRAVRVDGAPRTCAANFPVEARSTGGSNLALRPSAYLRTLPQGGLTVANSTDTTVSIELKGVRGNCDYRAELHRVVARAPHAARHRTAN